MSPALFRPFEVSPPHRRRRAKTASPFAKGGGTLRVEDIKRARGLFAWILHESPDPFPIDAEGDCVVFRHGAHRVALRPLDTDFFTFAEVFLRDSYDLNSMQLPFADVVDLGANIGLFAVRVAPWVRRVISVEPIEANLRLAQRNVSLAALEHKVALRRYAVTPQPRDRIRLFLSQGNHGGHSISAEHAAQWGTAGYEDVPAITLAELFDREQIGRCALLKCDIEGAEFAIIDAAPEELLTRIDRIIMEVHLTAALWRERQFETIRSKLLDCGFAVVHEPIHDGRGRLKPVIMLSATNTRVCFPPRDLRVAKADCP